MFPFLIRLFELSFGINLGRDDNGQSWDDFHYLISISLLKFSGYQNFVLSSSLPLSDNRFILSGGTWIKNIGVPN